MENMKKTPRDELHGQIIIGLLGLSQLGMAIWHAADPTKTVRKPHHCTTLILTSICRAQELCLTKR